jgi:hypothetical protein
MKTLVACFTVLSLLVTVPAVTTSCRIKKKGNCYCKYYSGDRTHYDLSSLPRNEQEDSCKVLDNNAEAFAGDCKLK